MAVINAHDDGDDVGQEAALKVIAITHGTVQYKNS